MASRIFISNAHRDRPVAEAVAQELESAGHATWVEWNDLATGVGWEWAVRFAFKECGLLVLILTRWSSAFPQVEEACKVARELGVPVVTLCFDEDAAPSTELELLIQPEFWLDCFGQSLEGKRSIILALVERLLPAARHGDASKSRGMPPAAEDPFPRKGSLADRPGMFCSQCGADNPEFLVSCRLCGITMLLDLKSDETFMACSVCTSANPADASYCRVCGSSLSELSPDSAAATIPADERPTAPAGPDLLPPPSPCGPECVGHRAGQWLLTRLLGRGGQGSVYEAFHVYLRTPAALKVLHVGAAEACSSYGPLLGDAMRRGLRGLARLDSPYVARLLDFGEGDFPAGRRHYLVTELVHGPSLRDVLPDLAKPGADHLSRALRFFRQLCLGVEAAHEVRYFDDAGFEMIGVRHGDIKPANVLLAGGEAVKLNDFLLFKLGASAGEQRTGTPQTRAYGTPGYMAPEQVERGEVTIATDVYGLGATLLQMLTLALPPDIGNVEDEASLRHALHGLNPDAVAFGSVLHRCLASDPGRRFATVRELREHLPEARGLRE